MIDELMLLRLVLVVLVAGLVLGLLKAYYNEWIKMKTNMKLLNEKLKNEENSRAAKELELAKTAKKKKSKKRNSSSSDQESQASSDDGGRARTSKSSRKRIAKVDLNDSVENTRTGILKQSTSMHVAQDNAHVANHAASTPAVKPSGSGINSTLANDDQSKLTPPKNLMFDSNLSFNGSACTVITASNTLTAEGLKRFSPSTDKKAPQVQSQQLNQTTSNQATNNQVPAMNVNMQGRIMARKPDVYDGETSIDDWVDSMKAYIEGTNPGVIMDGVRVSQIKLFMGPNALRMVKHILKEEFCDWVALKKCLESVFDRHTLKYTTLHGHFLFREQKSDESFSSFFNNLWTLCDEMAAMKSISDQDSEARVITQFTQGIHNIIVRNSVKQYINTFGDHPEFMSRDVYDAAKCFAKYTGVEEQYFKTYNDSAMLLKQRQEPATKVSVCNLNNPEQPKVTGEPNQIERKNQDQVRSRSVTPEKRASYNNDNRPPVTCYNCQQTGHVSRQCSSQSHLAAIYNNSQRSYVSKNKSATSNRQGSKMMERTTQALITSMSELTRL